MDHKKITRKDLIGKYLHNPMNSSEKDINEISPLGEGTNNINSSERNNINSSERSSILVIDEAFELNNVKPMSDKEYNEQTQRFNEFISRKKRSQHKLSMQYCRWIKAQDSPNFVTFHRQVAHYLTDESQIPPEVNKKSF